MAEMQNHLFRKACLISFCLLLAGTMAAQNFLELNLTEKNPATLGLFIQNDPLNKEWIFVRELQADPSGKATTDIPSGYTGPLQIRTSLNRYTAYVSSEKTNRWQLLPADSTAPRSYFEQPEGIVKMEEGAPENLDYRTIDLWLDTFSRYNYRLFVQPKSLRPALLRFDSLHLRTATYAGFTETGKSYYRYQLANLYASSASKSSEIFEKYLSGKVAPANPHYLGFVSYFFRGYLYALMSKPKNEVIEKDINQKASLSDLLADIHKSSPQLKNDTLIQLILLNEMRSWYSGKQNNPISVLSIINQVKQQALHPLIAVYANNLDVSLRRFQEGSTIRLDDYPGINGTHLSLMPKRTVPVLLVFYMATSKEFLRELPLFEKVLGFHSKEMEIRFVCLDNGSLPLPSWILPEWNIPAGYHHGMMHALGVRSVPFALFVGPDQKLIAYDAPMPSGGLNDWLSKYFRKLH